MTTLKELLWSEKWEDVRDSLISFRPSSVHDIDNYERAFKELLFLAPAENKGKCAISIGFSQDYYHIRGLEGEKVFSIEYDRWENWLSYAIEPQALASLSKPDIASLCLMEMTFGGFDQEDIQEEFGDVAGLR